ncbi:hypothetical protein BKA70DRAFT_717198 [Coprinopsis sp. MPI-PUGE-AT-0042]|nr:hypothetical protein BKA70DRAFT_717198 [Coprinopsis sp. MPI-PUGE-AT-0042]
MVHDPSSLPPELIAIAFVVENTDTVSKAWLNTLRDYVSPPLKRLINAYGIPLRIGVVSYGATDSLASPLSCKRFFAEQTQMTATLRTNSESLGIGTTAPAFNKGLASLEALVAAVELFDDLDQSHKGDPTANPPQAPRRVIKHIIHVAAAWPDGASVPSHNHDPNLDEVTWDTLPAELKKRNLNYNAILLRPQGTDSQYVKLHHALGQSTDSWFAVRPEHTLLLSKYPDPPKLPTPAPVHTAQQLQLLKQRQQQVAQALAQKQLEQQQQKQQAAQNAKQQPQQQPQQQPPSLPSQAPSSKRP